MGEHELTTPIFHAEPLLRWDDDLLNRRFVVREERPRLSEAARRMDIAENLSRHKSASINYSQRGQWKFGNRGVNGDTTNKTS